MQLHEQQAAEDDDAHGPPCAEGTPDTSEHLPLAHVLLVGELLTYTVRLTCVDHDPTVGRSLGGRFWAYWWPEASARGRYIRAWSRWWLC